jgi:hypothetical protein
VSMLVMSLAYSYWVYILLSIIRKIQILYFIKSIYYHHVFHNINFNKIFLVCVLILYYYVHHILQWCYWY